MTNERQERQKFQLHKKGYESIVKAIKSIKDKEVELKVNVEVNGATIKDIKLNEETDS